MKTFNKIEIAIIKRTAQNVQQYVNKKEKINAEIEKIKASKEEMLAQYAATIDEKIAAKVQKKLDEIAVFQPIIDSFQAPIKEMTGGYTTEDLIAKEIIHTGKIDTNTGKELLQTRFVLKYPETVIPPVNEEEVKAPAPEAEDTIPPYAEEPEAVEEGSEAAPITEDMAFEEDAKAEMAMQEEADPFADWQ